MELVKAMGPSASRPGIATVASMLPLWLFSFAILVEGFPRPPISGELAIASFVLGIIFSILLLWKRWIRIELVLYSLFPFHLLITFDEITTTYKTPFILLCALLLTSGIVGYQRHHSSKRRWLILLSVASITFIMAWHATLSFWHLADDLGYVQCFPDYSGCAPFTGQETPWWILFFSVWAW